MGVIRRTHLSEKLKDIEVNVDEKKLSILIGFLTHCVGERVLSRNSPLFTILLREAMMVSKEVE